jgi:hypothetical protein
MAREIERRIDELERVASNRPKFKVFDYTREGGEAEHEAYLANTPEGERAELQIILRDPTRSARGTSNDDAR